HHFCQRSISAKCARNPSAHPQRKKDQMADPTDHPSTPARANAPRKRRMSARWRYTNRLNARASTGPKTAAGKVKVARNARRHGLSLPVLDDPALAADVVELAHAIETSAVGQRLDGEPHMLACRVAETMIDLKRVRFAKRAPWEEMN